MLIACRDGRIHVDNGGLYRRCSKGSIECLYSGFLVYRKSRSLQQSIDSLMNDLSTSGILFDQFLGTFRVVLINHETNSALLFCDSSGSSCFFIDERHSIASDSLVELADLSNATEPDYFAVVQFMQAGKIFGLDTLYVNIQRSDPYCYYVVNSKGIAKESKGLASLSELNTYPSLHEMLAVIVDSAKPVGKVAAIITGGTDSRAVLANLMSFELPIDLAISGNDQHKDVKTARAIAQRIGKELLISGEEPQGSSWVMESFYASDGMTGVFSFYRLYRFYKMLQEQGYELVFGGLNGEIHKGHYLWSHYVWRDLLFPCSVRAGLDRFYDRFVFGGAYPEALQGDRIRRYFPSYKPRIVERMMKQIDDKRKSKAYSQIGYWLVQNSAITVSNSILRYVPLISPLFERDCVAISYNANPWKLLGQRYMRDEVSHWRPEIAGIRTVHGYSCSNRPIDIIIDHLLLPIGRSYVRLVNPYRKRRTKQAIIGRIDTCFSAGIRTVECQYAVNKCKELGVLPADAELCDIPLTIADRLTAIGLLYAGKERDQLTGWSRKALSHTTSDRKLAEG